MNLFKRCACPPSARCAHPFWVRFRIHGQEYRRSTKTANRVQAQRIATVRQAAVLEGREGLRKTRTIKLSEHIKHYTAHTAKANRTSYKDAAVLARLLEEVGDRRLGDVSPFHIEKWKGARAKVVGASTVNRELNIVRGCFSRAVDWERLVKSPILARIERLRVLIVSLEKSCEESAENRQTFDKLNVSWMRHTDRF